MQPTTAPPATAARGQAPALWQVRLLGAVVLRNAQGHALRLPSRAVSLLLARLAMAPGRQHAREELVELLWPGVDGEVGRNRLRQALSVLRSLLEPAGTPAGALLQADRRAAWLLPGAVACDVVDFRQALQRADHTQAFALYGGDLLPGFFEEWVQEERRALAEAVARLPQAAPAGAAPASKPIPTPETAAQAAPTRPAPRTDTRLPQYLTRFVGFETEGAALAAAVPQQRLVVLRGPGGGGKTRLAVEVAWALSAGAAWLPTAAADASGSPLAAFDLVAFVPLASCSSAAQLQEAVLLALHPSGEPVTGPDAVERALAGRHALLVLDNFEQLVDVASEQVSQWLARMPRLHLLVTSRRALGLDGEVEHALPALPLPLAGGSLQDHAFNPAVTLFVERARAARADFHLTERNHGVVADIVCALHGLPLAIELAAARVRSLGLADMRHMLVGNGQAPRPLELLARTGARAADDARHASMLHVLAWSWQQLSAAEQDLLSLLAVCDGGASLALLQHLMPPVAGTAGCAAHSAAALLVDQLVAASVAYRRESANGASRYHAFEPMRDFVHHQAGPQGLAALRARHAAAVAQWAAGLGREPELEDVAPEWPNLARALASAADPAVPAAPAEQAVDTVMHAKWALDDIPLRPDMLAQLQLVAAAAPAHRSAALHGVLAMHSYQAGLGAQADAHVRAALQALDAADVRERAEALRQAAIIRLRRGAPLAEVQVQLNQALQWAREQGQTDTEARTLTHCALVRYRQGCSLADNWPMYEQALALWRAHGPRQRVASGLLSLAVQKGGKHLAAEQLRMLAEVCSLATATGQQRVLALALSVTGYALADLRRYSESAAAYSRCLQMDWDQGLWREWFYVLWNLPRTLAGLGLPEHAAQLMGFAEAFHAARFGTLGVEDLPEARRTRRYLHRIQGGMRTQALWQQGAGLDTAQAMALALAALRHRPQHTADAT